MEYTHGIFLGEWTYSLNIGNCLLNWNNNILEIHTINLKVEQNMIRKAMLTKQLFIKLQKKNELIKLYDLCYTNSMIFMQNIYNDKYYTS